MKADAREKFGPLGEALADTRLAPVEIRRDTVGAVYRVDPRTVELAEMVRYATDVSREVAAAASAVKYNWISTLTQLSRELFASTEGALIDQAFALTQGACAVVAVAGPGNPGLPPVPRPPPGGGGPPPGGGGPLGRLPPLPPVFVSPPPQAAPPPPGP